ncbi:MAG: ribonuclease T [bacterium]
MNLNERFRGYLPVVVDLETGGFDSAVNPVLELACTFLHWQDNTLSVASQSRWHVAPFAGSQVNPASLRITGIDLNDPQRDALDERDALKAFFKLVRSAMKSQSCHRAIMVAHNASFDQGFINAACERSNLKRNPFHPFTSLDTASLAAVAYGHTVLSEACQRAGISFDRSLAHSAAYDADRTAQLFCHMVNGWPFDTALINSESDASRG